MDYRRYTPDDLSGILRLCRLEGWPSLVENPPRANRVLTAPGVTTMVAAADGEIAGFAQLQSDGEIQAHLSLIAVDARRRRQGIARELLVRALREAGGLRIDLITESGESFYQELPHVRMQGFRIYPEYSGPDRQEPPVLWKDGRKIGRG